MKKRKFLLPLTAFALLVSFGVVACGGGQGSGSQQQSSGQQEKITITAAEGKTKLILGEKVQLTASVAGVAWESKEAKVATVDANGLVTSVGVGSTTITATKDGYRGGTISITVELEKITISAADNKTTLVMDETVQLTASQKDVTWTSSNPNIASVSTSGLVTAVYAGEATITAAKDGFNSGTINITVTRPAALKVLHFEDADHYAADGLWSGSNESGLTPVYDRSSGNASDSTCLAHFDNGDKETLAFTSSAPIQAELVVTMASRSAIDDLGAVMSAKFNETAIDLNGKAFEGGSSSEFAEVSLGQVNIVSGDNALELSFLSSSAPYIDDLAIYSKQQATIELKPAPVRERITVEKSELTVEAGKTVQIVVTNPTSLEGVTFTSSDESAATVDDTGLVTGVSLGSANIIVRKEGMNAASVAITVSETQEAGEIRLEAELAEEVVAGSSNFMSLTDGTSGITRPHSGGGYISGYRVSGEEPLTFKFEATAEQAGTYVLSVNGSAAYQATEDFVFANNTTIAMNGTEMTINADAAIIAGDGGMSAPRVDATLGEVTVIAGENTLVVTFNGRAPSLDFFRLVPKA